MSINGILIAANKLRDYKPNLSDIEEVYESIVGDIVFRLKDGHGFMYDFDNDIISELDELN